MGPLGEEGRKGRASSQVRVKVGGHVQPLGPGLIDEGQCTVHRAPVLAARNLEVADLHRGSRLPADSNRLGYGHQEGIRLVPGCG